MSYSQKPAEAVEGQDVEEQELDIQAQAQATPKPQFTRQQIESVLDQILPLIKPHAKQVEVCGSYRRLRSKSKDIDIVVQPLDEFSVWSMLVELDASPITKTCKSKGRHIVRYDLMAGCVGIIPTEIYLAYNDLQFEVLKLIRTGDWAFNKTLCSRANVSNLSFRFSGKHWGLFGIFRTWDKDTRKQKTIFNPIPRSDTKTEEQIIERVMDRYYRPEERDFAQDPEEKPDEDFDQQQTDKKLGISSK